MLSGTDATAAGDLMVFRYPWTPSTSPSTILFANRVSGSDAVDVKTIVSTFSSWEELSFEEHPRASILSFPSLVPSFVTDFLRLKSFAIDEYKAEKSLIEDDAFVWFGECCSLSAWLSKY